MTFGTAFVECTKNSKIIGRKLKPKYIIVAQLPCIIGEDTIPALRSLTSATKDILLSTCKRIHYHNQLLKINLVTGEAEQYMPSAEDLFAIDWQIVEGDVLEEIKWRFNKEPMV